MPTHTVLLVKAALRLAVMASLGAVLFAVVEGRGASNAFRGGVVDPRRAVATSVREVVDELDESVTMNDTSGAVMLSQEDLEKCRP